ncbi:MAG TPA: Mut7-C RNAse domain-containing protein [bacterium]|nr:Mut7-C RNAse domain-containing protein [bacterium]
MRFAVDEMLGKLARWLRMMGFDVSYRRPVDDLLLIGEARDEERIILTRDTRLIRKLRPEEYCFISHDHLEDQCRELFERFPGLLNERAPLSRCVECNVPLEEIEKKKVKDKVWPFVFETQNRFTTCPDCGRIYWEATHVEKIKRRLNALAPTIPSRSG